MLTNSLMKNTTCYSSFTLRVLFAAVLALAAGLAGAADRVELIDGSVIMGKLLSLEGGKLKIETTFAAIRN